MEFLIRIGMVLVMAAVSFGLLVYAAKKLFPREPEEEYLGGKPKEQRDKLWMD